MKNLSKIIALFLAVLMSVSGLALTVFAEPESDGVTPDENNGGTEAETPEVTTYTVSVSVGNGGLSTAGSTAVLGGNTATVSVNSGDSLTFVMVPDSGYAVDTLTVNGTAATLSGNSYVLTDISADTAVVITFKSTVVEEIKEYNLTLEASGNGSIAVGDAVAKEGDPKTVKVNSNGSATITFSPVDGYSLKSLTVNGADVTVEGDSYTIEGFTQDTTVNAVFDVKTYNVTFVLTGKGSVEIMDKTTNEILGTVICDGSEKTSETFKLNGYIKFSVITDGTYDIACGEPNNGHVGDLWFFSPVTCDSINNIVFKEGGNNETPDDPVNPNDPGAGATDHTVKVSVSSGGSITVGTKVITGKAETAQLIKSGEPLQLTVLPDEGYEIKSLTVGGVVIDSALLVENKYDIESVTANLDVVLEFQLIGGEVLPDNRVTADDIDWSSDEIIVDAEGKEIDKSVFDKISASVPGSNKYVTFTTANGSFKVPFGGAATLKGDFLTMSIKPLTSGDDYNKLLAIYGNNSDNFKAFTFGFANGESLPANTKISFKLGGASGELKLYEYNGTLLIEKYDLTVTNGSTDPVNYVNESVLVCAANDGVDVTPDEDDNVVSVVIGESSAESDASDESDGGNGTLIVVLVIVLVAVLGAAALFVVKWRQEKF